MHGANISRPGSLDRARGFANGGGVTQLTSASWQITRFHDAIEDWFRYKGRTFDVKIYDRFKRKCQVGQETQHGGA
ncbi:hypothetical protein BDW75DRAFT_12336 [Aspergillus navahoensis]